VFDEFNERKTDQASFSAAILGAMIGPVVAVLLEYVVIWLIYHVKHYSENDGGPGLTVWMSLPIVVPLSIVAGAIIGHILASADDADLRE
jgi:hypothetical protein